MISAKENTELAIDRAAPLTEIKRSFGLENGTFCLIGIAWTHGIFKPHFVHAGEKRSGILGTTVGQQHTGRLRQHLTQNDAWHHRIVVKMAV